jgi:hypothetical protein
LRQVTRDVEPGTTGLFAGAGRVALAFARDGAPVAVPARLAAQDDGWLVGVDPALGAPEDRQEAVLLVDDGVWWFELRAEYLRGTVTAVDPPVHGATSLSWFRLDPTRAVAWDYGSLREA